MKKFYLSGQRTLANRGCEAIVRSTVSLLRQRFGDIEVLVPSDDIRRDQQQWPNAAESGATLVPAFTPGYARYWVNAQRLPFAKLKRLGWPFPMPRWLHQQIGEVDMVLSVGGDNYSLDYRIPSPLMGIDALALRMRKPVVLWGASVGPFEREPHFVEVVRRHLMKFALICVRESVSHEYLTNTLGLDNVWQMVDPAFALYRESVVVSTFWPTIAPNGVLGLNVSPLLERYKAQGQDLRGEVAEFVRRVAKNYGLGIILIPHVVPLDCSTKNNDAHYMQPVLEACSDLHGAVSMMPAQFNAVQIKDVISRLRFLIAARTHATIAALSCGVPTISIAYSIKARGINRDLFGHDKVLLPTATVGAATLEMGLRYLFEEEANLRNRLERQIPQYQAKLEEATLRLQAIVYD
mgnify:CR=1 FL=1